MGRHSKPIKVNFIVPDGVDLSERVTDAINTCQIRLVRKALAQCETLEQRNRMIDAIQARI